MKFKSTVIIVLTFLFVNKLFPQDLPNYPERLFQDSLNQFTPTELVATDGVIDPQEYKVGPGDKLFISISGVKEISNFINIYLI